MPFYVSGNFGRTDRFSETFFYLDNVDFQAREVCGSSNRCGRHDDFFYISEKIRCQTRFRDASSNEWLRFEGISYTLIVFIGEYFVFSIKKSEVATRLKMFKMTRKQIQF